MLPFSQVCTISVLDNKEGACDELLQDYKTMFTGASIEFVKFDSGKAADWARMSFREEFGKKYELLHRTYVKQTREGIHQNQLAPSMKTDIGNQTIITTKSQHQTIQYVIKSNHNAKQFRKSRGQRLAVASRS